MIVGLYIATKERASLDSIMACALMTVKLACTVVDAILEKLINEITMGAMDLHAIKASRKRIASANAVSIYQTWDFGQCCWPWRG